MSRGLGVLQREIQNYLDSNPAQTTYETLRWALFERLRQNADNSPPRLSNGRLPSSWNTSLKRALDALVERDDRRLTVERRRLESFDECVTHYPGKSLIAGTRKLRIALLPGLASMIEKDGQTPRYSLAENESYYLLNHHRENIAGLSEEWKALEPALVEQLPRLAGEQQLQLFLLIARGKSLFESKNLTCRLSIGQCVEPLVERASLPPMIMKRLTAFSASLLPPAQAGSLNLKSYVRRFADIPRTGSNYCLWPRVVDDLEEMCPETVTKLPGYKKTPKRSSFMLLESHTRSIHGPEIHKLFDKTVFGNFFFIRRVA
jgi:hypothetical protein